MEYTDGQTLIFELLQRLGVTRNYKDFIQTAYAAELCRKEPERLELVTKRVYPEVARRCRTSSKAVEKNIRGVRDIIWKANRPLLEELSLGPLREIPYPAQLLSILASSPISGPPAVHGLGEAAALAGEDRDADATDQPDEESGGEPAAAQDSVPPAKRQVGTDDGSAPLIAV